MRICLRKIFTRIGYIETDSERQRFSGYGQSDRIDKASKMKAIKKKTRKSRKIKIGKNELAQPIVEIDKDYYSHGISRRRCILSVMEVKC